MVVHTGPNTQSGGCQLGFDRRWYQLPISVAHMPAIAITVTIPVITAYETQLAKESLLI